MAAAKVQSKPASPEPTKAAKRKALPEIEVDLELPEPPSKRARRALKKGKTPTAPKPSRKERRNENADLADEEEDDDDGGKDKDKAAGEAAQPPKRSEHAIWIGNLPFEVTGSQLKKWLVDNSGGTIENTAITRVKLPVGASAKGDKKPNKGFAYVDFDGVTAKVAAMALSESDLGGRKVLIKDATSFEGRPEKPKADEQGGAAAKQDRPPARKVFVGNLSWQANEDIVWSHFEKCGEIQWVKLATFEDSGKCKGFGWVNFKEADAAATAVRGFARIKEEIATEEDFAAEKGDEREEAAAADEDGEAKRQKFKMRKWWVNRLLGRELKIELAEDDQLRYKKRFGRGAKAAAAASQAAPSVDVEA